MASHDIIDVQPGSHLDTLLGGILNALWAINDQLKPLDNAIDNNTTEVTKWLGLVVEAINNINSQPPPLPQPKGVIMATFKVAADNPDIQISLTGTDFKDSDTPPNPTGAGDIDLSVESSAPDVVGATLSNQTLSADGNSVTATIDVHFGAAATDIASLNYRATNRDTGAVVAVGSDDFIVQVGEAAVGTVTSSVPLTPEP